MGAVISALLFQPPRPASYTENDSRIIWLRCKGRPGKDPQTNKDVPVEVPSVYLSYKGSDLVLLYSHGNATDLGQMMPYLELLRSSLKINVFSYEYQGYGVARPRVKATEQRCYDAIEAAVEYLITVKKHPRNKIIVFGTSLGSGPSIYITAKYSKYVRNNSSALATIGSVEDMQQPSMDAAAERQRKHKSDAGIKISTSSPDIAGSLSSKNSSAPASPTPDHEPNSARVSTDPSNSKRRNRSTSSALSKSSNSLKKDLLQSSSISPLDIIVAEELAQLDAETRSLFDDNGEPCDSFRGLVLQSGFTSVIKIKVKNAPKFMDMFLNLDKVDKVDCPIFIIHGKVDEVVPFEHALLLKEKARHVYKPLFIDYAGHNNIMDILSVERYIKKIFEFIVFLNAEEQKKQEKIEQVKKRIRDRRAVAASPGSASNGHALSPEQAAAAAASSLSPLPEKVIDLDEDVQIISSRKTATQSQPQDLLSVGRPKGSSERDESLLGKVSASSEQQSPA